jgi:hypothetical protein
MIHMHDSQVADLASLSKIGRVVSDMLPRDPADVSSGLAGFLAQGIDPLGSLGLVEVRIERFG